MYDTLGHAAAMASLTIPNIDNMAGNDPQVALIMAAIASSGPPSVSMNRDDAIAQFGTLELADKWWHAWLASVADDFTLIKEECSHCANAMAHSVGQMIQSHSLVQFPTQ
ncbi:hypothetical protein [Dermatobacter hominis]|uniref:hypothetical protein n=1 Tax=Dermatobacter hominis TaxID=2884263 RepID=UPI001D1090D6|nr:hypothetical protein [Dermatobacter hominis]UDY34018.1 hypothetical protein LH044_11750 [Dermatobacter hominis]